MEEVRELLTRLDAMGVDDLRALWRERLGEPPLVRSPDILRRALAEALQMKAAGHGVSSPDRRLASAAARHRLGHKPTVRTASFKPGSTLVREWQGRRIEVEVVRDGFVWNGEKHASLSKVARLITGVRWNGPRFFGLRETEAA
ncbi:DUF2924 domain-containing protein [Brevundimonas sp.]|jgi:hypothetical protein|uniref:DUF2924 domain-containing protein n=1 Tax=Brevundimonas sp. TaxID=1871086 RepID=UPI00378512A6